MKRSHIAKTFALALVTSLAFSLTSTLNVSPAFAGEAEFQTMQQARKAYDRGEWDQAISMYKSVYETVEKNDPLKAEAALEWSNILWERGEYKQAKKLAEDTGNQELYAKSHIIEQVMERELGAKGIYPNVDFYSATTYHCIGLKLDLFTPMFALSRIAGWSGHVIEQLADNRLFRPKAEYVGPHNVEYVAIDKR